MLKWTEEQGGQDEPNWFTARFDGATGDPFALVEPKDDNKGWIAWKCDSVLHQPDSFQSFQEAKAQVELWYDEWRLWEYEQEAIIRTDVDRVALGEDWVP